MTRNSQHGTQKSSAWYALGLKMGLKERSRSLIRVIPSKEKLLNDF